MNQEYRMKKLLASLTAIMLGASVLYANADILEDREAIMKAFGKSAFGTIAPIVKGEKPFDATVVSAALADIDANAKKIDIAVHFPAGSTGEAALPKIWEDLADFTAKMDKFKADAAAAVAANPQDVEALKTQLGTLSESCNGCHEVYRLKKS
jgi:cytochrome c556